MKIILKIKLFEYSYIIMIIYIKEYDSNKRNIHLDAKNFNNDKFNEVFNDNRIIII